MSEKLAIYIHIPFCVRKCLYCDFLSGPSSTEDRINYIAALCNEIESVSKDCRDRIVGSIFFGGGTPSMLSADDMLRIMNKIRDSFILSDDCEISMEINPGTVDEEKIYGYKVAGINRMSIGLQSAVDDELRVLGRIHTLRDFENTYSLITKAGIHNVNVDLMSGIPEQNLDSFKRTLDYVTSLTPKPTHISAYSLIIEEGTPFYDMELNVPSEETDREMYKITNDILCSCGYHRYEISNYALEGYECEHNKVYWKRGDYLGLGLGAASLMDNVRWNNTSDMKEYLEAFEIGEEVENRGVMKDDKAVNMPDVRKEYQQLSVEEQMEEFMFLGLRLMEGVTESDFKNTFGEAYPEQYVKTIKKYTSMGMLKCIENRVFLTEEGINVSNVILSEFLF